LYQTFGEKVGIESNEIDKTATNLGVLEAYSTSHIWNNSKGQNMEDFVLGDSFILWKSLFSGNASLMGRVIFV